MSSGQKHSRYDWKRFWCPRGGQLWLDSEGYLVDPDGEKTPYLKQDAIELDDIKSKACLLLLGEPGVGKSDAMLRLSQRAKSSLRAEDKLLFIDLRLDRDLVEDFFERDEFKGWLADEHRLHLFIDNLDECSTPDGSNRIVGKLRRGPISKLWLRIACRTAEVPPIIESELPKLWPSEEDAHPRLEVFELAPLRKSDVSLAARQEKLDAEAFLAELTQRGATALATRPITLKFLLNQFRMNKSLARARWELYEMGCRTLCQEHSESRRSNREFGPLDTDQRMLVAGRIAAISVLGGRSIFYLGPNPGDLPRDACLIDELKGGVESAGDADFKISAKVVKEVFGSTGLFTERGDAQRLGWAHQTYAEFLCAYFLRSRCLSIDDLKGILYAPREDGRVNIVPALREVAAWLASVDQGVFQRLLQDDPRTLLQSDMARVDNAGRKQLVQALLDCYDKQVFADVNIGLFRDSIYQKLAHPSLQEQLEPWIRDNSHDIIARRGAIEIASACKVQNLQGLLADIALDASEDIHVRKSAAWAIKEIADDSTRIRLRSLAHGNGGPDPEDELKGAALLALWPGLMEAPELFACLTPRKRKNLMGSYALFCDRPLQEQLQHSDLIHGLAWVKQQDSEDHIFGNLGDRILRKAWENLNDLPILQAIVNIAHARFQRHKALFQPDSGPPRPQSPEDNKGRRRFLEGYLGYAPMNRYEHYWLHTGGMISRGDGVWILDRLDQEVDTARRKRWAKLLTMAIQAEGGFCFESANALAERLPLSTELQEVFSWLEPVELRSAREEEFREESRDHWLSQNSPTQDKRRPETLVQPSPMERTRQRLALFEQGQPCAFESMQREMSLKPTSTYYGDHDLVDLSIFPVWQEGDDTLRARIVAASKKYLLHIDPEFEKWLGKDVSYEPPIATYRALFLLHRLEPTWVERLDKIVWARLAPVVFGFTAMLPSIPMDRARRSLAEMAYRRAPEPSLWTLNILLEQEHKRAEHGFLSKILDFPWEREFSELLLLKVQSPDIQPSFLGCLLQELLLRNLRGAREYAASLLTLPERRAAGTERERALAAADALFNVEDDLGWSVLGPVFKEEPPFGREVVLGAIMTPYFRRAKVSFSAFSEASLAEFVVWMLQQFPPDRDPEHAGGFEPRAITPQEEAVELRNDLLASLSQRGTPAALEALMRIERDFASQRIVTFARMHAAEQVLQKTWQALSPQEIIQLRPRISGVSSKKTQLSLQSIHEIHQAIIQLSLDRNTLLGGIPPAICSSLERRPDPSSQRLSDLHKLNEMPPLSNGLNPLEVWLANACQLADPFPECEVLKKALKQVQAS